MENDLENANDIVFVYVTFANTADAERVATLAIESKLIACANIHHPHTSIYRWDGKVERQTEVAVIFKTTAAKNAALAQLVAREHSYDTPCIAVLTPVQISAKFAAWIRSET